MIMKQRQESKQAREREDLMNQMSAKIKELSTVLAEFESRPPPIPVLDSPARRGNLVPGSMVKDP